MPTSRFYDGQDGATHRARTFVFGRELRIVGMDDAVLAAWKLDRIRAAPEIDPDGVTTFMARSEPGVLLVDDSAELTALRRAGVRLPGQPAWARRHWASVGACLLATAATGILAVQAVPRWLAAAIPITWEQQLGRPAYTLMAGSRRHCTGATGQAALDRLVARLRAAGGIETPIAITVLDDPLVNAFALPGGNVMVMRGLIDHAADGPMLAGVIGHELGHVAHHDPATMLVRSLGFSFLLHMLGLGDAGGLAAASAGNLMNLSYGRAAEAAADAASIDFLTKAGLRADGLSRFFALSEQRRGTADDPAGSVADWFATHPSGESRRERTARPETGGQPFTAAEWQAIRSMCARDPG